jgi:hypothetical protein
VRWRPYRPVSLLQILEVSAGAFCRMSSLIGQTVILLASDHMRDDDETKLGGVSEELKCEAERLKIRSVSQQLARIWEYVDSGNLNAAGLHPMIVELNNRMIGELSVKECLMIDETAVKYYRQSQPSFGIEVQSKFPSASFEIDEAGKCLALNRSTASVFHLMRTMEIGVRAVARCLQISDPMKPANRNWGIMLRRIWEDGISKKWPTAADRAAGDGAAFEALHASLDAVKNPWRDATMHVENKYTSDEAENIFAAVRGFMMRLASRCDEDGLPLA